MTELFQFHDSLAARPFARIGARMPQMISAGVSRLGIDELFFEDKGKAGHVMFMDDQGNEAEIHSADESFSSAALTESDYIFAV